LKTFDARDAEPLQGVYSDDADWVNAFGTVKRGRDDIVEYLRGLFRDQNFNRGELAGAPETGFGGADPRSGAGFRASSVTGPGLVGGGTLDRDNFSLRALQRQHDGSRLIVSEMFQDANTETTHAHWHSGQCAVLFDLCRMTSFYLSRIWGPGWRRAAAEPPQR
jgi:hypothetical protein